MVGFEREHQLLRQALAFAKLGYWEWNANSDMVVMSERAAEIFGIEPGPTMTWTQMRNLLPAEDRAAAKAAVEAAVAAGSDYEIEYRVCRPQGGDVVWVGARGRAKYSNGTVQGMVGIVEDISARKVREQAREQEHRSLEILNRTGALIGAELDLEKLVQAVTDAGVELTGANFGAFFYNVANAQGESYMLYTLSGVPREAFSRFPMPRNTAVFAPTFEGKGIVRSPDILQDARYGKSDPHYGMPKGHLPVRSYLAAPVISRSGEVLGGLFFGHPAVGVFDANHEAILAGIAAQAAIAIDNSRLYRVAQAAETRYRKLVETLPQLVWSCLPDGTCNHLSRQWLEYTGLPEEEQLGLGWLERVVHPDDRQRVFEHWTGAVEGQHDYDIEFRIRRHDGVWRFHKARATPFRDSSGAIVQWFGTCTDIEDVIAARELQARLREELEQEVAARTLDLRSANAALTSEAMRRERAEGSFQLLVENAADHAIFMLDPNGNVTSWNTGAERIKGYKAEEIVGEHFSRFYTDEDRAGSVPLRGLEEARTKGKWEVQGWRVRKDGSQFWANVMLTPIRDAAGEVVGFAKVMRDISEWRKAQEALAKAQEQLAQSQKMESIGQLTGGVAHDFNNLLTIILGNLDSLSRAVNKGDPDLAKVARLADSAQRGAQRAASLTQRLLAFSRRAPLDPRVVDLGRIVTSMSDLLRRTLGERIAIETVLSGGLWRVHADPNQLEMAILNLAVNARDAMPDGGRLTIETANTLLDDAYAAAQAEVVPGQYAAICITDTGIGMTRDVVARAFEPFFTTKGAGHGTGLGLSQVYGFAKQSGGHVKIYSEPGEGTTVKLYLPRFTGDVAEDVKNADPEPSQQGYEAILVVEDEPDVRNYSCETLRELGYTVFVAADGEQGLRLLAEHPEIELLFTDVGLPGPYNGRQLADEAQRRRPGLRVLFTTGYARNAIVHDGRLDPGVQLLPKPFTYGALASKLRGMLDASRPSCRVLLVEDELAIQMLVVDTFEEAGVEVEVSTTAAEALQKLRLLRGEIDAAVIDLGLPDRRGDILATEMRSLYPHLNLIFATGSPDTRLEDTYKDDRRIRFLIKPYSPEALLEAIRGVTAAAADERRPPGPSDLA
jgi:PAS domain S-box-containing protein